MSAKLDPAAEGADESLLPVKLDINEGDLKRVVKLDINEGDFKSVDTKLIDAVVGARMPTELGWQDFDFKVGEKHILKEVSGTIKPGELCAIMGPSGAGKSSLMNILAGRQRGGGNRVVTGTMTVNGVPTDPMTFRSHIAYVMQEDSLFATQTPREALNFSAALRLPSKVSEENRNKLVESILDMLGLQKCSNTLVGSAMIKGLSGGEKKRTAVGVELVSNPEILFLDEPTSGLDSFAAFQVVQILQRLSDSNRTVITTIHQPSSEVFSLFSTVLLLANGRLVYNGPASTMADYFGKLGHPCPANFNPADHVMYLLQQVNSDRLATLADDWIKQSPKEDKEVVMKRMASYQSSAARVKGDRAGCCTQFRYLIVREGRNVCRDVGALIARIATTLFLNIIVGVVFLHAASWADLAPNLAPEGYMSVANNNFGAIVQVSIGAMFGLSQPALLAFPIERPVFMREYASNTYGALPYVISKLMVEIPMNLMQASLIFLVTYWTIDFNGNWFAIVATTALLGLVASSTSLLIGALVKDVSVAIQLTPLLFVPQLLFAGFFIPINQIPEWLRWAQYLCSLKYAINLVTIIEFIPPPDTLGIANVDGYNNAIFGCTGAQLLEDYSCTEEARGTMEYGIALLPRVDIAYSDVWLYVGILVAALFIFRTMGLMSLIYKSKASL